MHNNINADLAPWEIPGWFRSGCLFRVRKARILYCYRDSYPKEGEMLLFHPNELQFVLNVGNHSKGFQLGNPHMLPVDDWDDDNNGPYSQRTLVETIKFNQRIYISMLSDQSSVESWLHDIEILPPPDASL